MLRFNKNLFKSYLAVFAVLFLFLSCTKNDNPNNLPETVAAFQYLPGPKEGVVKILAIGNSFSEDAIESHLYELAKAKGKKVIIGNMYIGGASLEDHVKNALSNGSVYSYRKIDTNGVKKTYPNISIASAEINELMD